MYLVKILENKKFMLCTFLDAIFMLLVYSLWITKKKSLKHLNRSESYEEIDTRLASGWYVDSVGINKKKKYKTKEITFKISKKST